MEGEGAGGGGTGEAKCCFLELFTDLEKVRMGMTIFTVHEIYLSGFDYIFVSNIFVAMNTVH